MSINNSTTAYTRKALPTNSYGLLWGFLGVAAFSFTVPLTRFVVLNEGMSALFAGTGRAVIAAGLAAVALFATHQRRPNRRESISVTVVALGAVIGFPLLTSYASVSTPASHSAVIIAILPATTAVIAAVRTRVYPPKLFWIATFLGALSAIGFALIQNEGSTDLHAGDLLLLAAVLLCALSYAEGGIASKTLGSWQTISWGLIFSMPVMLPLTAFAIASSTFQATPIQWVAFGYLSLVSMFLGFFAWYRGLAIGPMPQVSQIQLIQPILSVFWAAVLLSEEITARTIIGSIIVIAFSLIAIRVKNQAIEPTQ